MVEIVLDFNLKLLRDRGSKAQRFLKPQIKGLKRLKSAQSAISGAGNKTLRPCAFARLNKSSEYDKNATNHALVWTSGQRKIDRH